MDINRLHYFCTVVQTGSLTKASELLHISQPALSKAIKTLEDELDKKLVIPSGRGIAITDEGKKVAEYTVPLLDKLRHLRDLGSMPTARDIIKIATFEVFSTYFMGKVISSDFKGSDVRVFEQVPGPMEESIVQGFADIGITYLPIPHPELDILKVATINMGIFGVKKFSGFTFSELPFVIPNVPVSGTPSKVKGLDGWPDHLIPRNSVFQVAMMETALDLCRRGECVGYFPEFVISLHNEKVSLNQQNKMFIW